MSSTVESGEGGPTRPATAAPSAPATAGATPLGLGDARELDQPGPVPVLFAQCGGRLYRQPGLAHPTGTDQRHQPARADRLAQLLEFRCCDRRSCSIAPAGCPLPSAPEPPETCRAGCGE